MKCMKPRSLPRNWLYSISLIKWVSERRGDGNNNYFMKMVMVDVEKTRQPLFLVPHSELGEYDAMKCIWVQKKIIIPAITLYLVMR